MKLFLKLLFLLPVVLVFLALSVANRRPVTIFLNPFTGPTHAGTQIEMQLDIVMLLGVLAGIVIGSVATWLEQGKHRRAARRAKNEANSLRAEVARLSLPRQPEKRKAQ
jgi:uncharacterized integral membrane protein